MKQRRSLHIVVLLQMVHDTTAGQVQPTARSNKNRNIASFLSTAFCWIRIVVVAGIQDVVLRKEKSVEKDGGKPEGKLGQIAGNPGNVLHVVRIQHNLQHAQ